MAKPNYDSLVSKRCRHPEQDWILCACGWFYHVTHGTYIAKNGKVHAKKHRGKIPDVRTHEEAKKAFALIAARIKNGLPAIESKPVDGITVAQVAKDWLSTHRGKASTKENYEMLMRCYVSPVLG